MPDATPVCKNEVYAAAAAACAEVDGTAWSCAVGALSLRWLKFGVLGVLGPGDDGLWEGVCSVRPT